MLFLVDEVEERLGSGDCANRPSPRSFGCMESGRGGGSLPVRLDEILSKNEFMKAAGYCETSAD
jgi:hypothetical protein